MATPPIEIVVAGTKGFALALLAPIAERIGAKPRVATDPAHALVCCQGAGSIVIVEFLGEDSLPAIKDLFLQGGGLRVVAAVPAAHAAAEGPLRALGIEPVRWDGTPGGVLSAVERQIAFAAAPPAPTRAARAPLAAAAPPVLTPPPSPAAAPAKPAAGPALTPSQPQPAVARAAPAAAVRAPAASLGELDDLDMDVDEGALAAPPPADAGPPPPTAVPAVAALPPADAGAPRPTAAPALAAPPPADAGALWPTAVPGPVDAADALGRALLGDIPAGGQLAVVADVVASLSELERSVLSGEPQAFDTEPVRRAAVMRVRVAVALATAPAERGAVDQSAISAFIGDIDALLSDVNALAAQAPPEVQVSLEAMRNALVKEAIDFSEAVQRAAPQGALAPAAPADAGRAARARVVSVASRGEVEIARAEARRHLRLYLVAGLAVLAAVGFHGYGWVRARQAASDDAPSRSGVPANAVVSAPPISSAPIVVRKKDGSGFTPDELKRMQDEESLKGNDVRETVPGSVLILPKSGEHPARPAEVKP